MPRVSIGMPVYNGEKYLVEALESVLGQTYTDFEVIVCDNASTDRTREICEQYAAGDPRLRYYRNETNIGAGRNYNKTFHLARGEFFKWAAHDDVCAPAFLERCVEALDRNPDVVLCFPKMMDIDERGNRMPERNISHIPRDRRGVSPYPRDRFHNLIRTDYTVEEIFGLIRWSVLVKTRLILNYTDSDRTLLAEIALYGRLMEVPEVLFYHRLHEGSSVAMFGDWQQRSTWFDPALAGRAVFPLWRQLAEYTSAVLRSPAGIWDSLWCGLWLAHWTLRRRRELFQEAKKGFAAATRRRSQTQSAAQPLRREVARDDRHVAQNSKLA